MTRSVQSVRGLRWWIAGLILPAMLINHLTIAKLGPVITAQFRLINAKPSNHFSDSAAGCMTGLGGLDAGVAALLPLPAAISLFALSGPIRRISFENTCVENIWSSHA